MCATAQAGRVAKGEGMTERGRTKLDEFRNKMGELERAKKETDRLRLEAIAELLQARKEINRELRQLGYEGSLEEPKVEPGSDRLRDIRAPAPVARLYSSESDPATRAKRAFAYDATRNCPICEIAGHDLRSHRGQTVHRRFTHEELVTRSLVESGPQSLSG
jgi:hypothetical protein